MSLNIAILVIILLAIGLIVFILKDKSEEYNNESERIVTDNTNSNRLPIVRRIGESKYIFRGLMFFWISAHAIRLLGYSHVLLEIIRAPVDGFIFSLYVILIQFNVKPISLIVYTPDTIILCLGCIISITFLSKIFSGFSFRNSDTTLVHRLTFACTYAVFIFILANHVTPTFTYGECGTFLKNLVPNEIFNTDTLGGKGSTNIRWYMIGFLCLTMIFSIFKISSLNGEKRRTRIGPDNTGG